MNFNTLLYTKDSGIVTIALNRPDKYNAFNNEMGNEMQSALSTAKDDEECRVIVLTGTGKAFCSGQDLSEVGEDVVFSDILHQRYNPIISAMRTMNKPIIGKINGVAAGAGCSLALACDFILASEKANFIEAFVNIGLVLDSGSSYFLPRMVGSVRAFEIATMGKKVSAAQALDWGMVNRVSSVDELDSATHEIAKYYSTAPTKAIAMMKQMLNASNSSLADILELEAKYQDIAGASNDYKEGVNSFLEKRTPKFTGS